VAWLLAGFQVLLALLAILMALFGQEADYTGWGFRSFPALLSLPFTFTGMIILARLPRHGMGWVFLALAAISAIQGLLFEYMLYSIVLYPADLPGGLTVAWILNFYWAFTLAVIGLILLLFPRGQLPATRWRPYVWSSLTSIGALAGVNGVVPGPMDSSFVALDNPYGWAVLEPFRMWLDALAVIVLLYVFLPPVWNLVVRFRQSSGIERQQYKWFVFAATLMLLGAVIAGPSDDRFLQSIFMGTMFFLPVAITIAILRHRLFDIDIIIRRTLQYALVTGILALIYFGGVVILQGILSPLIGSAESPFITVLTTLAVIALFNPLRTRIQDFLDRRFYRQKYNAEQTLAAFAIFARDEVGIDSLAVALLDIAEDTLQPEQVSLWLQEKSG
jgi:hypothetical protein